ncbi:MAG: pyridoxal-phosphate-dependent aminotransferase family protein [Gammaproteobacteria bacterium]
MPDHIDELNPPRRILMGPGPVDADPRVLRAMSTPLVGQFDPVFTGYMNDVMAAYRRVYQTENHWTLLVDGTARAGIETILMSILTPGDQVLVPVFGRFGHLLHEISDRCGARVRTIETDWGTVFRPEQIEAAIRKTKPRMLALVHGDTSTTMAQPLADIGEICRANDVLLAVDATATLGGMDLQVDNWRIDAVAAGLQKCMSGPPGTSPITINSRVEQVLSQRRHIERGIQPDGFTPSAGLVIRSNYFDLPMLMDYWSEARLNHHTEATSMLYGARECARVVLEEGLQARFQRHRLVGEALCAGLTAMGLELFGDQQCKMANVTGVVIPKGVDDEAVRSGLLDHFGIEIGTSFGPLRGQIWRIGTMGYACRKENVLICLGALEATLRQCGYKPPAGKAVDAALDVFGAAAGA